MEHLEQQVMGFPLEQMTCKKVRVTAVFLCALTICGGAPAQPALQVADNERLELLYGEDQVDRHPGLGKIDWAVVGKRDDDRRNEGLKLLQDGRVRTAKDHFRAAMIFQHGSTVEDARLAYSLAWISVTLDPSDKAARWLSAAAWDRMLMRQKKPQWYGTQFRWRQPENQLVLYDIDESAVSDEERASLSVPSLAESKQRTVKANQ